MSTNFEIIKFEEKYSKKEEVLVLSKRLIVDREPQDRMTSEAE